MEVIISRGVSRVVGKGGPINISTTGGGYGRGHTPSRDSKGGAPLAPPVGSGAKPQKLFAFAFI